MLILPNTKTKTTYGTFKYRTSNRTIYNKCYVKARAIHTFREIVWFLFRRYYTHKEHISQQEWYKLTDYIVWLHAIRKEDACLVFNDTLFCKKHNKYFRILHKLIAEILGSDIFPTIVKQALSSVKSAIANARRTDGTICLPARHSFYKQRYGTVVINNPTLFKYNAEKERIRIRPGKLYTKSQETNNPQIKPKASFTIPFKQREIIEHVFSKYNHKHTIVFVDVKPKQIVCKIDKLTRTTEILVQYQAELVYLQVPGTDRKSTRHDKSHYLAIDFGYKYFVSIVSDNPNIRPFLVRARNLLKLIAKQQKVLQNIQSELPNQHEYYYRAGKQNIGVKSYIKKLIATYGKLQSKIDQLLDRLANEIIRICRQNGISVIVYGDVSKGKLKGRFKGTKVWKYKFYRLPFSRFIRKLKERATVLGIRVIRVSESYTSSVSAITGTLPKTNKQIIQNGKRITRGLFKDTILNKVWHADLNGALNIATKGLGLRARQSFLKLKDWLDRLARPMTYDMEPAIRVRPYLDGTDRMV